MAQRQASSTQPQKLSPGGFTQKKMLQPGFSEGVNPVNADQRYSRKKKTMSKAWKHEMRGMHSTNID